MEKEKEIIGLLTEIVEELILLKEEIRKVEKAIRDKIAKDNTNY